MKQGVVYGGVFASVYLIFVIATIPARLIFSFVALPEHVVVENLSGTVWQAEIKRLATQDVELNQVTASLSPWSLLMFDPAVSLAFGDDLLPGPQGEVKVSGLLGTLTLTDADILLAANDISRQLDLPVPVSASGDVSVQLESLVFDKPFCAQASGLVSWKKAKVTALEQNVALGPLSADIGCEEGALTFTIQPKNDLGLTFSAYLRQGGKFSGQGYLQPADKFPEPLKEALPFLGKKDAQGRYRLGF
ncbi:type II secretion system protein N [Thalassomonas haliotis]|uniref:Type II secretion system protein N n=1 Tax=Thalassomonas haliotis TaxID=485448 RepID=A0ABY7VG41_9GAMM|nr:type II secretion system protein N [Thalassomonas haliotis]WDE11622.1 type II secretion system protein N [Thalassomonas haliotis]